MPKTLQSVSLKESDFPAPHISSGKIRFFVFDSEGMWTNGAWRLVQEGHEVRFFSQKESGRHHLENMVPLVKSMEEGLKFVGKDGYIICGDEQDLSDLRKQGFKCYGGNKFTHMMENDREFQAKVCQLAGIKIPNFHPMESIDETIKFIKNHPDQYVLKQMGHAPKTWNFVGKEEDGGDVILQLEWMKSRPLFKKLGKVPFMLQEIVDGLEFACGAWWVRNDWLRRPDGSIIVELNREHKKQGVNDSGLTCGESGTVMKLTDNTKLFSQMLDKLTPVLKSRCSDVIINIDANCGIVEETEEAYLFEITPREGYPACDLQQLLIDKPVAQFFMEMINGEKSSVEPISDWGVVTVLGAGTYPVEPYGNRETPESFEDQPVIIPQWEDEIDPDICPCYIKYDPEKKIYRIADPYEYVLACVASSHSIKEANKICVENMEKIIVRAPQYRTDVGEKFEKEELPKLESMGYV